MERERASGQPMTLDLLLVDDACQSVGPVLWSLEAGPERAVATGPELFDDELDSIKSMPERDHTCVKVKLGGTNVLVWKPHEVMHVLFGTKMIALLLGSMVFCMVMQNMWICCVCWV